MTNSDLLPSLLFKINQNQLALEAAIMELTLWIEHRDSADVSENVRGVLRAHFFYAMPQLLATQRKKEHSPTRIYLTGTAYLAFQAFTKGLELTSI